MEIEPRDVCKVFEFRKAVASINRLVNKKLNIVEVDDKLQIVECRDTQNQPTITRAESPLSLQGAIAYFEVEVLRTTEEDSINVGLTSKDSSHKQLLGKGLGSFGYLKGDIYLDKKKVFSSSTHQKLRVGDRIGIGIDCMARSFFVVKNQAIIQQGVEIPVGWNEFFPAVGLANEHEKVKFFFEPSDFNFKVEDHQQKIQDKLQSEIVNGQVQNSTQIYSLVYDYLRFNHYEKTLALLETKQIDFPRLPRFTHSPNVHQLQTGSNSKQKNKDEEMKQPMKGRSRVMSEKLNQEQFNLIEVRRKNTQMALQQQNPRKCSMFSNISNISNIPNATFSQLSQAQDDKYQQNDIQSEAEQFLRVIRMEIIQDIREKRIQRAIQLLKDKIKIVFEESYVMAFMKAHIFLRKVKEESNREAIVYSKAERQSLEGNYGALCPFFSSKGKVEWKPLSTVFLSMAYNIQTDCSSSQKCCDILSDQQFVIFANFIDRLILHKMGYLGCSRLSFLSAHIHRIQEKLHEFKGMGCGIELNI